MSSYVTTLVSYEVKTISVICGQNTISVQIVVILGTNELFPLLQRTSKFCGKHVVLYTLLLYVVHMTFCNIPYLLRYVYNICLNNQNIQLVSESPTPLKVYFEKYI